MQIIRRSAGLIFFSTFSYTHAQTKGYATMWATSNQYLIGSACEYANAPVNSLTDPVLASYLRSSYHCAIGDEYGKGEQCGECYRLISTNDNGQSGTPGKAGSAVVMVSNSGAGGTNHFDCILPSFEKITGAQTGIFDITYEQTECVGISGLPDIMNWADQNAYYCKMMFQNIGGWGSLASIRACLDGDNCKDLDRFSGQTWTGCPSGTGASMIFTLTQQSPSGQTSNIVCACSGQAWPWPTWARCECPSNFQASGSGDGNSGNIGSTCSAPAQNCLTSKCCADAGLTCYEKDEYWAGCNASCVPGIDANEDPEYQTPWSCVALNSPSTSFPGPASSPSPPSASSSLGVVGEGRATHSFPLFVFSVFVVGIS